ncbi:MAG: hypothetical protein QXP53_02375 [Candidatus Pacearchaeota archaeon]
MGTEMFREAYETMLMIKRKLESNVDLRFRYFQGKSQKERLILDKLDEELNVLESKFLSLSDKEVSELASKVRGGAYPDTRFVTFDVPKEIKAIYAALWEKFKKSEEWKTKTEVYVWLYETGKFPRYHICVELWNEL